jgi:hypothetical protein
LIRACGGGLLSNQTLNVIVTDADIAALKSSNMFDEDWYLREYPDVALTGMDPAHHFLWIGQRLGRQPRSSVQNGARDANKADGGSAKSAVSNGPPKGELVTSAHQPADQQEGSDVGLIDKALRAFSAAAGKRTDPTYDLVALHFDTEYYLMANPDVAAAGVDPIRHYLDNGWRESRDPNLTFSTRFYVENNPDVVAAGVNPFYHFLAAGQSEGRPGKHQLGFRWDILATLKPVAEQINEMKSHRSPARMAAPDLLLAALQQVASAHRRVVLSFSHDDFTQHVGGVQLLLRRELGMLMARGDAQIHLFPVHPLPFLDTSGDDISLGVLINGKHAGNFSADVVSRCLRDAGFAAGQMSFIIHSLLGHNMDQTIEMIAASGASQGCAWLHDYSMIYNNFKLLRNDVAYSGFPKRGTIARKLCEYARADFDHELEFSKLFNRFKTKLLSPSKIALDIFKQASLIQPESMHVIEHVQLQRKTTAAPAPQSSRPLRVGFLGYPVAHKGWPIFEALALKFADDPRYAFHHLGKGRRGGLKLSYTEVSAGDDDMDAMRSAVEAAELDIALIWSIWPETFCLTAYEALAGGAALVTNPSAGNVVSVTEATGIGIVLDDESALFDAFASGRLLELRRSARSPSLHVLNYSALSLEAMD